MAKPKMGGSVKIVMIEYHHVQTDVSNFKSIVQSLTGKPPSRAVADDGPHTPIGKRQRPLDNNLHIQAGPAISPNNIDFSNCTTTATTSFKDLDRLLNLELPSMEDFSWICAD